MFTTYHAAVLTGRIMSLARPSHCLLHQGS